MGDLSNLMVPDVNGDHPLSALSFSSAMSGYLAGDFTHQQAIDYMNSVIISNGGSNMSVAAEGDILAIKTHFDSLSTVQKLTYFIKVVFYSIVLEETEHSMMTANQFDTLMSI